MGKVYVPIPRCHGDGSLTSHQLGLRLRPERERLRLIDPKTDRPVLNLTEQVEAAKEKRRRREVKRLRSEVESLNAEVKRLRKLLYPTDRLNGR